MGLKTALAQPASRARQLHRFILLAWKPSDCFPEVYPLLVPLLPHLFSSIYKFRRCGPFDNGVETPF